LVLVKAFAFSILPSLSFSINLRHPFYLKPGLNKKTQPIIT
jgi:hypothetical protein